MDEEIEESKADLMSKEIAIEPKGSENVKVELSEEDFNEDGIAKINIKGETITVSKASVE